MKPAPLVAAAALAAVSAGIAAQQLAAHTAATTAACVDGSPRAVFTYAAMRGETTTETIYLDGRLVYQEARPAPSSGTAYTVALPIALTGDHVIRATTTYSGTFGGKPDTGDVAVYCGPALPPPDKPAEPTPTPTPVPDPGTKPAPQPRGPLPSCADLLARGAGLKWLQKAGCVRPPKRYQCPPRLVTPRWQVILRERHGVTCPTRQKPGPVTPAVAGSIERT